MAKTPSASQPLDASEVASPSGVREPGGPVDVALTALKRASWAAVLGGTGGLFLSLSDQPHERLAHRLQDQCCASTRISDRRVAGSSRTR